MIEYLLILLIFASGSSLIILHKSYFRKLVGLNIIQVATILLYLQIGYLKIGEIPFFKESQDVIYTSPLPQVLMLTAVVVGFATFALGVSLCFRLGGQK